MFLEIWLLPSLLALVCNGLSTFLPKILLQSLKLLDLVVFHAAFFLFCVCITQLFYGWPEFQLKSVLIAMASGAVGTIGQLLYLLALKRTTVAPVSMVSGLYPLVATVLAFIFLQEPLSVIQGAGVILGVFSIILLVVGREKEIELHKALQLKNLFYWLLPALGAMVAWGIWAFIPKLALQEMSTQSTLFYAALGDFLIVIPIFIYLRGRVSGDVKGIRITFVASVLTAVSMFAYFFALSQGPVAVIATLTAMYPMIAVLLARIILKEKISRVQFFAISLGLVAIGFLVS